MRAADIDIYDPDQFVRGIPHDTFDWMRANEPVFWNPEPSRDRGFYSITRYDDVRAASHDWETYSNAGGSNIEEMAGGVELMMVNMDPPQHTKLRNLVNKGFFPRIVNKMEDHVREIATDLIDKVAARGECDLVTDISSELPLQVICEMIGVPHEDRHRIITWSNTMIGIGDTEYGNSIEAATTAALEMLAYADELGKGRRLEPTDDVISILVNAEIDGQHLTSGEFDMFFLLLCVAGNETTRNLITGGTQLLIENPEQRARLEADPSMIPSAVEEMLRMITPVMHFRRTAKKATEIRGVPIKEGDKVVLWYIAANRDPEVFPDPHSFDAGRTPNEHLAFGAGGPHFCLGASLARLEIKVMFEELLRRMPNMQMAGETSRLRSNFVAGIKHLPVTFTPERT